MFRLNEGINYKNIPEWVPMHGEVLGVPVDTESEKDIEDIVKYLKSKGITVEVRPADDSDYELDMFWNGEEQRKYVVKWLLRYEKTDNFDDIHTYFDADYVAPEMEDDGIEGTFVTDYIPQSDEGGIRGRTLRGEDAIRLHCKFIIERRMDVQIIEERYSWIIIVKYKGARQYNALVQWVLRNGYNSKEEAEAAIAKGVDTLFHYKKYDSYKLQ